MMRLVITDGNNVFEGTRPPVVPMPVAAQPLRGLPPEQAALAGMDLRPIKAEAMRLLQPGNPIRESLLQEPDYLPGSEAGPRMETYIRLLCASRRPIER